MWGKLHRELIVITIISVLILAVSFAFNFSASQKDILERQTYDYLLDAAHHTKVILHTEIQRQNELYKRQEKKLLKGRLFCRPAAEK